MQRIVVIGGGIRGSMFAAEIARHADAELVGVCEPHAATAEELATGLGVVVEADVATLLSRTGGADAAVIATPDHLHRDVTLTCLAAGLDLLVEKPLATSVADADAMLAATVDHGCYVALGFENRWNPRFLATKRALRTDGFPVTQQIIALNDTIEVPTAMLSWAAGSSPGWFLFPHALDLAMWLGDSHPVSVYAAGTRGVLTAAGIDTWDAINATVTMADGSLVSLHSSWVLPSGMPMVFDFRYEVQTTGSRYALDIADSGVHRTTGAGAGYVHPGPREGRHILPGGPQAMVADWIDKLNGADVELPDAAHGAAVTHAIDAVHRSLASGRPESVTLPPEPQHLSHAAGQISGSGRK